MIEIRPLQESEFGALREANIQVAKKDISQIRKMTKQEIEEYSQRHVDKLLEEARASSNNHFMAIVLQQSEEVIGSLWYRKSKESHFEDLAYLVWFGLYAPYQNQGYGKQAMNQLTDKLVKEGLSRLALEVFDNNVPACGLYKSCGFVPVRTVMHKYLVDTENQ